LASIVTLLVALTVAGGLGWASERRLAVFASEVTLWQDAAAQFPDSYVAQFNLGTSLSGAGQQIEAIEHLQRAAELKPDSAEVHFNWGRALDELRLPRDAVLHYEEALRLKPDFVAAHNNLGILLANSGRFQAAIDHYQAAVDADPAFAPVRGNLAAALAAIGRTGEAIVQLEEAVRLQPTASAYANLAYGYALLHRSDDAIEAANYALQLAKRDNDPRAEAEIAAWLKQYARQPSQQ
jgi:tetratricopeptide (TPR) repeat protein